MITRRKLFKNLGAAVVVGAVEPKTLIPVRELLNVAGLRLLPHCPYAIERLLTLLTLLFGVAGWRATENLKGDHVDIHVPNYLDAESMQALARIVEWYRPLGVVFRLHADVPVNYEGVQVRV